MAESEKFMKDLETKFPEGLNIEWSYSLTTENMLKNDGLSLVYYSLNGKPVNINKIFAKLA